MRRSRLLEIGEIWHSLSDIWLAGRGRKAAVAAIAPLVEQSRRRMLGITDIVWLDPYMIGFMIMLITLVAKREAGIRTSGSLAQVQSSAWAEITGINRELIGEEVALLNATRNDAFEIGCHNALVFGQALYSCFLTIDADLPTLWEEASRGAPLETGFAVPPTEARQRESEIAELWVDFFDARASEITRGRTTR